MPPMWRTPCNKVDAHAPAQSHHIHDSRGEPSTNLRAKEVFLVFGQGLSHSVVLFQAVDAGNGLREQKKVRRLSGPRSSFSEHQPALNSSLFLAAR